MAAGWSLAAAAAVWLRTPFLVWGLGPTLATNLSFLAVASALELLAASPPFVGAQLVYRSGSDTPRRRLLAATRERIPLSRQFAGCFWHLWGWPLLANGTSLALLMAWAVPGGPMVWWPNTWARGVLQFVCLVVVADLGLYWGHRVQHEVEWLWRMHAHHHAIDTPSAFSTLYIHKTDAALQGSIPFALAALAVRPAPGVLYAFLACRIAENALNHSGLDSPLLDALSLKVLPLRARVSFHDAHHKYSNHAGAAKNYGETFWVWDAAFGTLGASALVGRSQAAAEVERAAKGARAQ